MHNQSRHGQPHGGGPRDERGSGGGGGGGSRRRKSDDDHRRLIREVFGDNYHDRILDPHIHGYNDFLERVKRFVQTRATHITPHQLRNIFSRVKRARAPRDLFILRPQLAYVAGRSDREEMRELIVLLDDLIQRVDEHRLEAFKSFYEAIIAYHKYFDPKGS